MADPLLLKIFHRLPYKQLSIKCEVTTALIDAQIYFFIKKSLDSEASAASNPSKIEHSQNCLESRVVFTFHTGFYGIARDYINCN